MASRDVEVPKMDPVGLRQRIQDVARQYLWMRERVKGFNNEQDGAGKVLKELLAGVGGAHEWSISDDESIRVQIVPKTKVKYDHHKIELLLLRNGIPPENAFKRVIDEEALGRMVQNGVIPLDELGEASEIVTVDVVWVGRVKRTREGSLDDA